MTRPISPIAELSYESRFLHAVQLGAQAAISQEMIHSMRDAHVEEIANQVGRSLVLQLRARIYEDPHVRVNDKHVIREQISHPTWKHALIASLPATALFRRRLLGYYFEIDPSWGGRRITHTVEISRRGVFPDMQTVYPDSMGTIQYVFQKNANYVQEEL